MFDFCINIYNLGFREILFCISIYVSLFHLFGTMYLDYVCQFQSLPVEIIHLMDTYLSNLKEFISLMNSACQILIQTRFLLDPVEEKISLKFHLANFCSVIDGFRKKWKIQAWYLDVTSDQILDKFHTSCKYEARVWNYIVAIIKKKLSYSNYSLYLH